VEILIEWKTCKVHQLYFIGQQLSVCQHLLWTR